jgi:Lar family restriction alleviation protein
MTDELKPCPFCGCKATLLSPSRGHNEGGYEIHCFNNDCQGMVGQETKQEMIDAWNKREPTNIGDTKEVSS